MKRKLKTKYSAELVRAMYSFIIEYDDRGAPSFHKFARSVCLTTEDLISFRSHKKFDRAYRECQQIRRDYLIDRALEKRFDASFTKFLLSDERDTAEESDEFLFRLEVKE